MPILFHALAMLVDKYGEMSIECAPYYAEYGVALLGQARADTVIFGDNESPSNANPHDDSEENDEEGSDAESDIEGEGEGEGTGESTAEGSIEGEESAEALAAKDALLTEEEKKMPVAIQQNIKRAINVQDIDLAIENLDVARVLYENHLEKLKTSTSPTAAVEIVELEKKLASAFEWLAEAEMEKEAWSACLTDLSRCLEIRDRIEPPYSREIAAAHNLFAKYYFTRQNPAETVKHFVKASNVFVLRALWKLEQFAEETASVVRAGESIVRANTATAAVGNASKPASAALLFPTETGNDIMSRAQKQVEKMEKLRLNLQEYDAVRAALADKIADCKDEIRSGADDGDKIRRMIKQMMPSAASGFGAAGFEASSAAFRAGTTEEDGAGTATSTSTTAPETINVLQVKRKRPVGVSAETSTTGTTTGTTTSTSEGQDVNMDAKKQKL